MLRVVLGESEVVPSSSSMLRRPVVACGHPFEFGCGGSAAAVWSAVGARPEVERGARPSASRGCRSATFDRADLGFEGRSSGAGRLSTPAKARGLQASWSKAEVPCEQSPFRKLQNKTPPNPAPAGGRLPPFQAIMVCDRNHFEERLEPAAKRR